MIGTLDDLSQTRADTASGLPRPSASIWWLAVAVAGVIAITIGHYWTDTSSVGLHNVYRRLAYIPIVLAAFSHGVRGGVLTALAACAAYFPHAFLSHHRDPSPTVDKIFEMILYLFIGGLTGWLVHRRQQTRLALERSLHERDVLERQLIRAGKMSALGQMTAGLAHEIRNPLASITGSAEALVAEFDESHRKYRLGQLLLAEINRLNRVVTEFVRFARPTPPKRDAVDLRELAENVLELSASEASKRGVDVRVDDVGRCNIEADRDQLNQVLLNLLLNAFQAFDQLDWPKTSARCVCIRFRNRELAGGSYLGMGVEDNGPGIPEELREEVFNPYFSTRPSGTGLGLSVSNRIIEAHGGFMEIESDGDVQTVWFYLPTEANLL